MLQNDILPPAKKRKTAKAELVNASLQQPKKAQRATVLRLNKPARPVAKKAAVVKLVQHQHEVKVAKVVKGQEAWQLLIDAGILTALGNVRRRFK